MDVKLCLFLQTRT